MTDVETIAEAAGDEALMQRYARGDADAFEVLFRRYRRILLGYLVRQLRDRGQAEELYQETWMRVIRARDSYRQSAAFRAWLFTIAHNLVLDQHRRSGRRAELTSVDVDAHMEEVASIEPGPEAHWSGSEDSARLLRQIRTLPFAQRDVILLRLEGGLTLAEIVAVTGEELEAVRSRLRYAMRRLREGMDEHG